jgi:hypothetical protein
MIGFERRHKEFKVQGSGLDDSSAETFETALSGQGRGAGHLLICLYLFSHSKKVSIFGANK